MPMKILFLITSSLESPYGRARCLPLARELASLGHQITILALHHDLSSCSHLRYKVPTKREPIQIHYVGQMHVLKRGGQKYDFPLLQLLWVVFSGFMGFLLNGLQLPADAVHVGKPQPQNGMAGWLISRLRCIRLFVDCDDYEAQANRFSARWQQKLVAWMEDWLPCKADGVTVNTYFLRDRYLALGVPANSIVHIPNGTDPETVKCEPYTSSVENVQKRLKTGGPVIGYVGALDLKSHPVNLLFDAFELLVEDLPQSQLLIVGSGADEAYLGTFAAKKSYSTQIIFTGQVTYSEALSYYNLTDVIVDPVYADDVARARCPLKLIESLATGCPIVTGDVGDRRELLGPDFHEWLVNAGSSVALAKGIQRVLEAKEKGRWPKSTILKRANFFNWLKLAREWEKIYNSD